MNRGKYQRLVEALRLCALQYPDQAGALPEFVFVPDEVFEQFNEAYGSLSKFESMRVGSAVKRLNKQFEEMTNADDRDWAYSVDAMRTDERWNRVRALAAEELVRLGEPLRRPIFPNTIWVGKSSTGEVVEIHGDEVPIRDQDTSGGD